MELALYTKKGGRYSTPTISITTSGQIGINSTALDKYIKGKKYVLLYGSMEGHKKVIGIKPVDKNDSNTFAISYSEKRTNGSISGHSFLKHLEIDFKSGSKKFTPEWDDKEKMILIKVG